MRRRIGAVRLGNRFDGLRGIAVPVMAQQKRPIIFQGSRCDAPP